MHTISLLFVASNIQYQAILSHQIILLYLVQYERDKVSSVYRKSSGNYLQHHMCARTFYQEGQLFVDGIVIEIRLDRQLHW